MKKPKSIYDSEILKIIQLQRGGLRQESKHIIAAEYGCILLKNMIIARNQRTFLSSFPFDTKQNLHVQCSHSGVTIKKMS